MFKILKEILITVNVSQAPDLAAWVIKLIRVSRGNFHLQLLNTCKHNCCQLSTLSICMRYHRSQYLNSFMAMQPFTVSAESFVLMTFNMFTTKSLPNFMFLNFLYYFFYYRMKIIVGYLYGVVVERIVVSLSVLTPEYMNTWFSGCYQGDDSGK